jgi:hypothetical protein
MADLSTSAAFDLAIAQKSRRVGIPWSCAVCGSAGVMDWENTTTLIDLMYLARGCHYSAAPECTGHPLVIETALVFRRCR